MGSFKTVVALSTGLLVAGAPPVAAQLPALPPLDSGIPRPGDDRLDRPEFLEERPAPPVQLPAFPPSPEEMPLREGPRFVLHEVRIEGSTVFPESELAALSEPFIGQLVSTGDLQQLRRALTLYYVDRGYISSGVVLPDQKIIDGVVRFRVIEGRLQSIEVSGTERLPERYVSSRLTLDSDRPLNVNDLEERIQILLDDAKIERVDARLAPGARAGESTLDVDVEETFFARVGARFVNNRPPSVGGESARVDAELRSVLGFGETFMLYTEHTSGLSENAAALEVPVTPRDTRLFVRYRDTSSRVIEAPFDEIDIRSTASNLFVGVFQPLYRKIGKDFTVGLGLDLRESQTFIFDDIPFSFSPGPQRGKSNLSIIRFSQSWFDRRANSVLAARSMLSFGLDAFGATINPSPLPDATFFAWLGQAQWVRRLSPWGTQAVFRADAQLTPDRLLALEQFPLGGARTVRGYRENQLVRDNGYALSAELRIPIWRKAIPALGVGTVSLEVAPFFDFGQSWNHGGPTKDLIGAGVGLRLNGSGRFFGSVYFAERFSNVTEPADRDLQDDGFYFDVQSQLVW